MELQVNKLDFHIAPLTLLGLAIKKNNLAVIQALLMHGARMQKVDWQEMCRTRKISRDIQDAVTLYLPYFNESFAHKRITHYTALGVPKTASASEIKKAYYAMAKAYHPDHHCDNVSFATEIFKIVNNAYECLSNTKERLWYDVMMHFDDKISVPTCQVCHKHCFAVALKAYTHSCCDKKSILCATCERKHASVAKEYLRCCG